ncbi:MAG: hypothetical protein COB04_17435, partial [Gammaproteobacteria bacterium]
NLYVILIAPPGVGKSEVTKRVDKLWRGIDEHFTGATSLTAAALIDELSAAERTINRPGESPPIVRFNSLKILSNEFGVLMPSYEPIFMNTLADLYDGTLYSEKRRTKNLEIMIKSPQLNLLAATTPDYLGQMLPDGAWEQGFMSRVIMVYNGEQKISSLFKKMPDLKAVEEN